MNGPKCNEHMGGVFDHVVPPLTNTWKQDNSKCSGTRMCVYFLYTAYDDKINKLVIPIGNDPRLGTQRYKGVEENTSDCCENDIW